MHARKLTTGIIVVPFSGFDIRQFISKRTCISSLMSVAFLTLVLGFLFGKSTSDRHHLIRENNRKQNGLLLEKSDIDKIEASLLVAANAKMSTSFNESYSERYQEINTLLQQHWLDCIGMPTFNTTIDELGDFVKQIVRQEYNNFINCSESLNLFLQGIQ